jgi:D-threo-aldose 1-dehydrogenase
VPFEPTARRAVGRSGLAVTSLGFGGGPIGGLFSAVADADAVSTVERAWESGIRYFDTAPLYGYGASERRIGSVLAGKPRDAFVVSTKVGRLIRPKDDIPAEAEIDRQAFDGRDDAFYIGVGPLRPVFDYSYDGTLRSIEESLVRLGLSRIDMALIHDPDDHWDQAIGGAYVALHRLRQEGVLGAIGAGMNQSAMLARFAREGDFDVFLLAGRYTLLDQEGLRELLPLCVERDIAIVIGGAMNSGILADPRPGSTFNYSPAPAEVVDHARRLAAVCDRHGVSLKAAAVQFPLAHPAVVSLLAGVRRIGHLDEYQALYSQEIPAALWDELREEGLLPEDAPTPAPAGPDDSSPSAAGPA